MARNSLKSVCRLIEQINETVPPEQAFLGDLKRSIELTAAKEKRKPSQTYKPSSLGCIRSMYYQIIGADIEDEQISYMSVGICNAGSDIHNRIQTAVDNMKDNGIDCEYIDVGEYVRSRNLDHLEVIEKCGNETKLYHKGLNMRFLCDGIIRYKARYYILEIKSEASIKWQNRTGVDPAHYNQGTAYSLSLLLDDVIFLYVNRDIFDIKAYLFTPTDEMKHELVGLITDCDGYVKRMITPPKPTDISRRACTYCGYKNRCARE